MTHDKCSSKSIWTPRLSSRLKRAAFPLLFLTSALCVCECRWGSSRDTWLRSAPTPPLGGLTTLARLSTEQPGCSLLPREARFWYAVAIWQPLLQWLCIADLVWRGCAWQSLLQLLACLKDSVCKPNSCKAFRLFTPVGWQVTLGVIQSGCD